MRLLLTGATGVAGLNIYRAALTDPSVDRITLLMRRDMPSWAVLPANAPEKTTTILHSDFSVYTPELAAQLAEHDACIWAQGKSSVGMNESDYTTLTHTFPMALVKALQDAGVGQGRGENKPFRFVYVSGGGADPTQTSSQMWARVKGRAEVDIAAACDGTSGMAAHVLRPAGFGPSSLYPADALHQRTRNERMLFAVLIPPLKLLYPPAVISAEQLGATSMAVAKGLYPEQKLFTNKDLLAMSKTLAAKTKVAHQDL